jgi:hypothetical protein
VGAKGNEQIVELIGFWVTSMEDAGRLKRSKYASRSAVSREGSGMQGEIEGLGRGTARGVCTRERSIGE